jgi:hypothetical protein
MDRADGITSPVLPPQGPKTDKPIEVIKSTSKLVEHPRELEPDPEPRIYNVEGIPNKKWRVVGYNRNAAPQSNSLSNQTEKE